MAEQDTKEEEVKKFLRYNYPAMKKTQVGLCVCLCVSGGMGGRGQRPRGRGTVGRRGGGIDVPAATFAAPAAASISQCHETAWCARGERREGPRLRPCR